MSDIIELLKSLGNNVTVSQNSYVHFDKETGKISKITSRPDASGLLSIDVLEVPHEQVKDILEGTKRTDDFIVAYDISLKQIALKELSYKDNSVTVSDSLYRLPVSYGLYDKDREETDQVFKEIYDGMDVFLWIANQKYYKNCLVWFENNVYLVLEDINSVSFPFDKVKIYVKDVFLTTVHTRIHMDARVHDRAYDGIFVDVWYDELEHLAGQHVWYQGTVYRIKKDQKAKTKFRKNNAVVLCENVKLKDDVNKSLTFDIINIGDLYLDNNLLYVYNVKQSDLLPKEKIINWNVAKDQVAIYDSKTKTIMKWYLDKSPTGAYEFVYEVIDNNLTMVDITSLYKGDKFLLNSKIVEVSDIESDLIISENRVTNCWELRLSNAMKRFFDITKYKTENIVLNVSITSKYDPNILYRTFQFSLKDLVLTHYMYFPFETREELEEIEMSLYTTKYFDSYTHEILR